MMQERKTKIIAASATGLLFISLSGLVWLHDSKQTLGNLLDRARLDSEKLLSEKLLKDKEIAGLNTSMLSLSQRNESLDNLLSETNAQLAGKEKEVKSLQGDKAKARRLEREIDGLRKLRKDLEGQLTALRSDMEDLNREREVMNRNMMALRERNETLESGNALLRAMMTDNYRVDATRRKQDKLTVVARKAGKLTVGFDVPKDVIENLHFKVKTPEGKVDSEAKDGIVYMVTDDKPNFLASTSDKGVLSMTKRIEMTYKPEKKMSRGIYQIEVFNGDNIIGSCQVRLR